MIKINPDILVQAICRYGERSQIEKAQEECQELVEALNDYLANPTAETINHVAEETADVLIMAHQLAMIFSPSGVRLWVKMKMERLKGLLALGGSVHEIPHRDEHRRRDHQGSPVGGES